MTKIKRAIDELWMPPYLQRKPSVPPTGRRFMSPGFPCCCEEAGCLCCSGTKPDSFDVSFTGVGDETCDCSGFNDDGPFTVDFDCCEETETVIICRYFLTHTFTAGCNILFFIPGIQLTSFYNKDTDAGSVTVYAATGVPLGCKDAPIGVRMRWSKAYTGRPPCSTFVNEDLTTITDLNTSCDPSGSTCKITAN